MTGSRHGISCRHLAVLIIADANYDSLSILAPSLLTLKCRHLCRRAFFVLSRMLTQRKYSQSKFYNTFFYKQLNAFGHAFGCLG